mgnify:CR=1 FL=1
MSHNVTPNTSRVELRKTLTLVPVVMMGLAYMQPMTLFDTFGIVSGLTDGHVPTAYAFALIAILFTALSYGKLVRRYPSAGSAYTYAQKSISPTVGFMVGWSSLLDYLFAPMINILLAKIYFEALVPSIPSWMFVVALVAFMTAFNLRSLKSVANFNTVIVLLQVVLIAVILGMVYNYLPYMVLPLYTIMVKIDNSVIEAAQDLGANVYHVVAKVLVPLSMPGITTGITMVFVPSISTFIISRMLGGGSNLLIGDLIELQFLGNSYNYNLGSAMSLVLMVIVLLCMSFTTADTEEMEAMV